MTSDESIYPHELDGVLTIDGSTVTVRALADGEADAIRELYAHLSPRTRYLRFLSPMAALPDTLVTLLSSFDYRRRLALVAELDQHGRRLPIGLGSFHAMDDGSTEVGLVVQDDWQRRTIGTALAARLLLAAERRGHRRFIAHVLSENVAMRKLLARVGRVVSTSFQGGVSEIVFVARPGLSSAG